MKKVFLTRIFHREKWRYAINFDYDPDLTGIVKDIIGAQYSSTHRCWCVDATEENLRLVLKSLSGKALVDISAISLSNPLPPEMAPAKEKSNAVFREVERDDEEPEILSPESRDISRRSLKFDPVEFRISEEGGRFIIRFTGRYDKTWIDEMKTYGKVYYDKRHREFLLTWSKITVDSLSDYFSGIGVQVKIIRPKPGTVNRELRKDFGDRVRTRELNGTGLEAVALLRSYLEDKRYSARTVETYVTLLELFFKFFTDKNPDDITQNDVADFMNDFIIKNEFSASYQNQMVSAIKLYYEISGRGKVIPQFLERPRRGRALPKVFSKEEITLILNSARNTKHKLLLWIIYSCGLRRSEVINIRLDDIDRKRNIIHIREGKGGVDRIVPVPDKLWQKLDEYVGSYSPKDYLFEGQYGGRYSSESVYNVFKNALSNAGIKKEVGVHSLRHSYATHLHENGLDIRYIQELLGHKSTRTTEIYTHVSRRNLISVRSPIEDLDVK
ncbi:MAG TPA: site-specific tyrosine recombinase/integron integrase [Bacteroidales bacterium]|nr:site-specific tyrosine recombinase/integron integrase [Bacteroidales bacterium]